MRFVISVCTLCYVLELHLWQRAEDRVLQVMHALLHKLQFWYGAKLVLCWAGGRDADGLIPVLHCLCKFIVDPRYARLLLGVAHRVLDTYAGEVSSRQCVCFASQHSHLSLLSISCSLSMAYLLS